MEEEDSMEYIVTYLDLQQIVATDPLVVHLVVRIIRITTTFVFYKCEASPQG